MKCLRFVQFEQRLKIAGQGFLRSPFWTRRRPWGRGCDLWPGEKNGARKFPRSILACSLRVVSNFGDGACGAGEIHTRMHSPGVASPRNFARAYVCISSAPKRSLKLETTRSLSRLLANRQDTRAHNTEVSLLAGYHTKEGWYQRRADCVRAKGQQWLVDCNSK